MDDFSCSNALQAYTAVNSKGRAGGGGGRRNEILFPLNV